MGASVCIPLLYWSPAPSLPQRSAHGDSREATHLHEDLRPVLILLVRCHEKVAGQHRHEAVPFGLEVDRGVPPQEAAQGLEGR